MSDVIESPAKSHIRKPTADFPEFGFVRLPQILKVLPLCRSTFLNGVAAGKYPKPVRIGAKAVAWKVEDIRALFASFEEVE